MRATTGRGTMPIYLDRHDLRGLSALQVAEAHRKDLEVQGQYGVQFLTYWFDHARGTGFCLVDAPDAETALRVHAEAHGEVPIDVIEVQLSDVQGFLGRIADPLPQAHQSSPAIDSAFRAVMFTDIVDSTGMTARLGDAGAFRMVRAHDGLVRRALAASAGREVKHTGDGIMASFDDVSAAAGCARAILQALAAFNRDSSELLAVRVGIHAGEPVQDNNDLFGATVQIAARICQDATPQSIYVSETVRRLLTDDFHLTSIGSRYLKGIPAPVDLYEIAWR
jgi:Adenylate cyclase, family 3 (some proteins contain HAMP domain)